MTDAEIYDRTLIVLTAEHVERFGETHAIDPGRWFTESMARCLVAAYKQTRNRRPWCRLPWQRGRRRSPDPIAAKHANSIRSALRKWDIWNESRQQWEPVVKTPIDAPQ